MASNLTSLLNTPEDGVLGDRNHLVAAITPPGEAPHVLVAGGALAPEAEVLVAPVI